MVEVLRALAAATEGIERIPRLSHRRGKGSTDDLIVLVQPFENLDAAGVSNP
jgi:hypothetical protein